MLPLFALVLLFCQTDLICIFKFSHLCCHKMHSTFEPTKLNGVVNICAIVNICAAVECLSLIVRIRPLGCQFPAMWFRLQRKTAKTRYMRTIQVFFLQKALFHCWKDNCVKTLPSFPLGGVWSLELDRTFNFSTINVALDKLGKATSPQNTSEEKTVLRCFDIP